MVRGSIGQADPRPSGRDRRCWDTSVHHHVGQSAVAVVAVLEAVGDDRLPFPALQANGRAESRRCARRPGRRAGATRSTCCGRCRARPTGASRAALPSQTTSARSQSPHRADPVPPRSPSGLPKTSFGPHLAGQDLADRLVLVRQFPLQGGVLHCTACVGYAASTCQWHLATVTNGASVLAVRASAGYWYIWTCH